MQVAVQDLKGRPLSPCSAERAQTLVQAGQADWLAHDPPAIRLFREVRLPTPALPAPHPLAGKRTLLHICCAPCATYTARTLREAGAILSGYWYNPNIQPYSEHEKRRNSLFGYASEIGLPMMWAPAYDMIEHLNAINGREQEGMRCQVCYRLRLESTARVAAERGFQAYSTTLLISPYQDLAAIRQIGDEFARTYGVEFYWENLRRGLGEQHRLAQDHALYLQRYCGCVYSEWEALDRAASTGGRAFGRSDNALADSDTPG
jgi:predicted adenine nucleotide alpha hydrolase (AANH) superfamily ATPase